MGGGSGICPTSRYWLGHGVLGQVVAVGGTASTGLGGHRPRPGLLKDGAGMRRCSLTWQVHVQPVLGARTPRSFLQGGGPEGRGARALPCGGQAVSCVLEMVPVDSVGPPPPAAWASGWLAGPSPLSTCQLCVKVQASPLGSRVAAAADCGFPRQLCCLWFLIMAPFLLTSSRVSPSWSSSVFCF